LHRGIEPTLPLCAGRIVPPKSPVLLPSRCHKTLPGDAKSCDFLQQQITRFLSIFFKYLAICRMGYAPAV